MVWAIVRAVFRRRRCPACYGYGFLKFVPVHPSQGNEPKKVTCDDCLGTGLAYVRPRRPAPL